MTNFRQKGSTLTEVVVVAAIISAVSLVFLGTFSTLSRFHEKDLMAIKAGLLAEEGIEALRLVKGSSFENISSIVRDTDKFLALSPYSWILTTVPEIIDGKFYRSFQVHTVSRGASDDIVVSGGIVDPNTLLLDVSVLWNWRGATSTANYKSYITNI